MDKKNFLAKSRTPSQRFNISTNETSRSSPIAESTCINSSNTMTQFRWGDSPISPKNQLNSSRINRMGGNLSGINNSKTSGRSNPRTGHIFDPRVYVDVQSKGFASRIVKYENGARLSRSTSANCLYSKPGQFPVVHLKKTELPYKATKQPVSMTRIAPPEKSTFYGNTLSGLLRSNSVLGLQNTDDSLSHENRPILHPPPNENDMAPTRSVLDVLKEISRKRINSDELNHGDVTKKYCSRNDTCAIDSVDAGTLQQVITPSDSQNHLSYKRQREPINNGTLQKNQFLASSNHKSVAVQNIPSGQCSPEQLAKRRFCSYNNDISSSLSSSVLHMNKRKLFEQGSGVIRSANSITDDDYEKRSSKTKLQCRQQAEVHLAELNKTINCTNIPITLLPDTPLINQGEKNCLVANNKTELNKTVPPQRSVSVPSVPIKYSAKPKITLFNKQYDSNIETEKISTVKSDDDDGICTGIAFVRPKKSYTIAGGSKNPIIERAQKSKLALMLCGLRGELYQGDAIDELDKPVKTTTVIVNPSPNTTTVPTTTTAAILPLPTAESSVVLGKPIAEKSITNTTATDTTASSSVINFSATMTATTTAMTISTTLATTTSSTIPILGGFKFTPHKSESVTTTSFANSVPIITASTKSPLVGIKLTPQIASASPQSTNNTNDTTTATFNFDTVASTSNFTTTNIVKPTINTTAAPSIATTLTSTTTLGGFSFGLTSTKNTNSNIATTASTVNSLSFTPQGISTSTGVNAFANNDAASKETALQPQATTAANTFVFGNNNKLVSTSEESKAPANFVGAAFNSVNANKPTFTFESNAVGSDGGMGGTVGPIPATDATLPTNGFLFNPITSTASSTITTPITTVNQPATTPVISFSFGNKANVTPPTNFQFGSSNTKPLLIGNANSNIDTSSNVNTQSTFIFGTQTPSKVATVAPSGNNAIVANSRTFSFQAGNTSTTATTPFSFGGNNKNISSNTAETSTQPKDSTTTTAFDSVRNASSFSFSTNATNTDKMPAAVSGSFSFSGGNSSTVAPIATNLFNTTGSAAPNTGIVKPSFSFAGSLNQQHISSTGNTQSSNSINKPAGKPLFGSSNATLSNNNTFGSLAASVNSQLPPQNNNTFAFGSNSDAHSSVKSTATNNIFNTSGFTFNSANTVQMNKPTAVTVPTAAFSFSGAAPAVNGVNTISNNNNISTPFSFGSIANANISTTPNNKPFAFGSNTQLGSTNTNAGISVTNMTAPTSNIFNATSNNTATPAPSFNFNAGNASATNGNNNFAPPPAERIIRKATRRLQKS